MIQGNLFVDGTPPTEQTERPHPHPNSQEAKESQTTENINRYEKDIRAALELAGHYGSNCEEMCRDENQEEKRGIISNGRMRQNSISTILSKMEDKKAVVVLRHNGEIMSRSTSTGRPGQLYFVPEAAQDIRNGCNCMVCKDRIINLHHRKQKNRKQANQ